MQTCFAWCRQEDAFDPLVHKRCDLDILTLAIDQQEGEVALATVMVAEANIPSFGQRHAFITCGDEVIFSGRLVGLPVQVTRDLVRLEFTAEPLDAESQLQRLSPVLKQFPFWDPLFADPHDHDNPAEWLEARNALFCWCRVSGRLGVSDLFQGEHTLDFTDVFFEDSLKVALAETPLARVSVNLTAEWIQEAEGEVSLGGKIAAAFSKRMVNTLTPHALQETWFREGQRLGRSGYWVVQSRLRLVTPPSTGILGIYPTVTPEIMAWDEANQLSKVVRAKRFWMTATLVLGWRYRQKRRETVRFTLAQKTQLDGSIRPLGRSLNLRLQELPDKVGESFFQTRRGRQAVEHALERARAHLAATARCLEIEVTVPFQAGLALSLDHSVRLADPRIPGGEATGKVVAYRLYQDGLKSWAWVRLAVSIGGAPEQLPSRKPTFYAEPGYGDTAIPSHYQTVSGLAYGDYSDQRPTGGIVNAEALSVHDIVQDVGVAWDGERQVQVLQSQQYPVCDNVQCILETIPTSVSLDLLNLETRAVADHVIHLPVTGFWTAPRQIELGVGL